MDTILIDCYQNLANAIVELAANDYIWALKAYRKNRRIRYCVIVIEETEKFFLSEYFVLLTSVDGEYLMKRIRRECGYHGE
jgi:hypothetical protein